MARQSNSKRTDALSQLKTATKMLADGEAELKSAQEKINKARGLISQSTDVLRKTWAGTKGKAT